MNINNIRTLAHPNIYSHHPTLVMRLELNESDRRFYPEDPDFIKRLENLTAGSRAAPKIGMREIRTAKNDLAEAVKRVALALIDQADLPAGGVMIRSSGDAGIYEIAFEYQKEEATRFLLETAVEAVEAALKNQPFETAAAIVEAQAIAALETDEQDDVIFQPIQIHKKIPIIAVTGTNGKTTVTRLISHILFKSGFNVGTTTTSGIYFNGEVTKHGDTTGPVSAQAVLENEAVDAAVLETARGGIMRGGLGWDWADVAVVTNITEDHIGQNGIEMIKDLVDVKSLIAERVCESGTLVLNADDRESAALAERAAVKKIKKRIVRFALSETNPILERYSTTADPVYFVRGGRICEKRRAEVTPIIETAAIPMTMGGTADFQIQNAMAAAAAARALGVSKETIAAALSTFRAVTQNPGRTNLYRVGAGYALIDYGHNADGFAAVCRMTRRWAGKTVTGIISLPGDRDNRIIEEAARVAVRGFDRLIVSEEFDPRGRATGEMAKLLSAAIERERPGGKCEIIQDEIEAFSTALARLRKNEVVVMFYRRLNLVLEILSEHRAVPVNSFDEAVGGGGNAAG